MSNSTSRSGSDVYSKLASYVKSWSGGNVVKKVVDWSDLPAPAWPTGATYGLAFRNSFVSFGFLAS